MKKLLAPALLLSLTIAAQNHEAACGTFVKVNEVLQDRHFEPKPIDDSLSIYVFEAVMDELDNNRSLFLQQDYDLLAKHRTQIDDYLIKEDCAFFTDFIDTYRLALERRKKFISELSLESFNYAAKDTMYYAWKAFPYHTEEGKIKKYLRKKLVYDILEDIAKTGRDKDSLKMRLEELEKPAKARITDAHLCRINALLNPSEGFESSIYNLFYSTFCSYFDPHSTYFNYNEKASFISSIATENYSLGLYVTQNNNEEIIIEEVIPGGPAHSTRKIDKGDQLIKLAANDTEYTVSCASIETINTIVASDNYKVLDLTLRKKDGTIYSVSVEKKVMKADDHSVYSYIIGDTMRVGYIKVPSFYTALDGESIKGCADDVAKEIAKLQQENISGLIIDLQYNGGGSMDEVIKLAGMFIDFGPLAVVIDRNNSRNTIKDYNRGTLYSGPMVVLVNGFSASASEFFAGVMQDYNRAVIAGSPTLGKATMQTILQLKGSGEDFVKVTIDKFYRVTGASSQYSGVIPDVELPAFMDRLIPRESSMPTAIKNDSISFRTKYRKLPDTALKQAIALSRERIEANADFSKIKAVNKKIEAIYLKDKEPLPLAFDNVFDDVHSMDDVWGEINAAAEKEQDIKLAATGQDTMLHDEFLKNVNEFRMKAIKTDPNIYEGFNILNDLRRFDN